MAASTLASPMPRVLWKCSVNTKPGQRARAARVMRATCAGWAMPVVSQSVMPPTPRSAKRCTQPNTRSSATSPSKGQPNTQESDTFTATPAACAMATTGASAAKDCSQLMRRLARLCVALTDITRFSSSARDSMARSAPRRLGTRAA